MYLLASISLADAGIGPVDKLYVPKTIGTSAIHPIMSVINSLAPEFYITHKYDMPRSR